MDGVKDGATAGATTGMTGDLLTGLWFAEPPPHWSLRDWEDVLGQARQCRLQARLATLFVDRAWMGDVAAGPAVYLRNALRAGERQRREVLWEIDRLEAALSGVDTPVVVLKGAAYLIGELPAARGRLFSDIDIMVARDRLEDAERALFAAGWIPEKHDAYDERYYREWMHELPPLRHVQRGTFVDMHHTITPPTSRYRVAGSQLLSRARPVKPGSRLQVLAPEDMLLHSAVHLMQEGDFNAGLRDLLDMSDLLTHFEQQPDFWPTLLARAAELGLGAPLGQMLAQIRIIRGKDWPDSLRTDISRLNGRSASARVLQGMLSIATRPHHPSCNRPCSPMVRWLLYVRSHLVRMPLHLVVPHLLRKAYLRRFPQKV